MTQATLCYSDYWMLSTGVATSVDITRGRAAIALFSFSYFIVCPDWVSRSSWSCKGLFAHPISFGLLYATSLIYWFWWHMFLESKNQDLLSNSNLATFWLIYLNLCYAISEWKWKISTNPRNELKEDNVKHTGNFKLAYASENVTYFHTESTGITHTQSSFFKYMSKSETLGGMRPSPIPVVCLSIPSYSVGTGPPALSECHLVDTELCEKRTLAGTSGLVKSQHFKC